MQPRVLLWSSAVLLGLWSVFHLAVGVYHTILFAQDPMNLFTVAYHVTIPSYAANDPALRLGSDAIEVRENPATYRLLTTMLDPDEVTAADLAATFTQRWEIEPAFDELKTHQRGPRTVLRSKSPDLV